MKSVKSVQSEGKCDLTESYYEYTTFYSINNLSQYVAKETLTVLKNKFNLKKDLLEDNSNKPFVTCNFCNTAGKIQTLSSSKENFNKRKSICYHCVVLMLKEFDSDFRSYEIPKQYSFEREAKTNVPWDNFLKKFIGQNDAKKLANQLLAKGAIDNKRKSFDLNNPQFKLNALFQGAPGTGKTTFAKALGHKLKDMKLLSVGELFVKTKADLIGCHVGDTEIKVQSLVKEAKGSILFIDEAYNLVPDKDGQKSNDFGYNALQTLMEEMDKLDNDIMIIFAGYEKDLARIFEVNPGYKRRFPHVINFQDFTLNELVEIFSSKCSEYNIITSDSQLTMIKEKIKSEMVNANFGNGGYITNLLEKISLTRDERLYQRGNIETITKDELTLIEDSDIPVINDFIVSLDSFVHKSELRS